MKSESKKISVALFLVVLLVSLAAATNLENIEDITPLNSQIDVNGSFDLQSNKIEDLANPDSGDDAMPRSYADTRYLERDGNDYMNGLLDMNNNNIDDVASIDGGGNAIQVNDNLALNNNNINGPNSIQISDAGPDGEIDFSSGAEIYSAPLDDSNSAGYLQFVNDGGIAFEPSTDGTTAAEFNTNNNLDMKDNQISNLNLQNVNSIEMDGNIYGSGVDMSLQEVGTILGPNNGETDLNIQTQGGGSHVVSIEDGSSSNVDIARFEEGTQNVVIPNGNLNLQNSITTIGGKSNTIGDDGDLYFDTDDKIEFRDSGSTYMEIGGSAGTGALTIDTSGNLDTSGQLSVGSTNCGTNEYIGGDGTCKTDNTGTDSQDLSNTLNTTPSVGYVEHDIQISGGSDTVARDYYDPNTDSQSLGTSGNEITLENGGSVTAPYANNADQLDGVQLSNINWGDTSMAQSDVSVSDLGAADANLNMNSYNINSVSTINNGGSNVNTGGTINVGSGSVTASQRMCMGDRCA